MTTSIEALLLDSIGFRFRGIKALGDKTIEQMPDADLVWTPNDESNSAAVIIRHLHGNMMSRWTDFLTTDGDKPSRDRDAEFEPCSAAAKETLLVYWNEGWACTLDALDALTGEDLTKEIKIRGRSLGVIDAILRQLNHYAYHVGQLVSIAKARRGKDWETLSIPRGQSGDYTPSARD